MWLSERRKEEYYRTIDQRLLGNEGFVTEVKKRVGEKLTKRETILRDKNLETISKKVEELTGITKDQLQGRSRKKKVVAARSLFVHLSLLYTSFKRKEIPRYLNRVPRIIAYLEQQFHEERWKDTEKKLQW